MYVFALLIALIVPAAAYSNVRVKLEPSIDVFGSRFWTNIGSPLDSDIIHATFVIKRDMDVIQKFEAQLLDLSTPSSANYGKWLTKEQIVAQTAPPSERLIAVTEFLAANNILPESIRISDLKDKVFVQLPAAAAASLFQTEFARFQSNDNSNIVLVRTTKPYSLPEDLNEAVSFVDNLVRLPTVRRTNLMQLDTNSTIRATDPFASCGTKCAGYTTPAVLQQAYSFTPVTKVATGNSMAVAEFQNQYYDQTDLTNFQSACGVSRVAVDIDIGGNNAGICKAGCTEALLDVEYIEAVAAPIPLTFLYQASYSLLDWADYIIALKNSPLVHSVSYGNDEIQQTSPAYMESCNTAFMQAGALGLSILFASGDQGVYGRSGGTTTFHPDFPASSPYITSVGGTNFKTKSVIGAETTWNCGGGGFSNEFTTPTWQKTQVSNYLTAATAAGVLPKAAVFNSAGRAYPDVAALGGQTNPYCVALQTGNFGGVAGTSASCPVVAGIFAQLNNVRLAAGKSSLGWLNPFIYADATAKCFNDVSDSSTNSCSGPSGFAALSGWDPATGFGSPNFACLAKLV